MRNDLILLYKRYQRFRDHARHKGDFPTQASWRDQPVRQPLAPGHTAALYGEMTKAIMETLREARGPLSVREIVRGVLERLKLATNR